MSSKQPPENPEITPGLARQLAAILYDALQVIAVLMLVTLPFAMMDLGQTAIHQSALVLTIFAFFAKFWRHGGQTLGMKSWDFRIVSDFGRPITLTQCLLRLIGATASFICLGAGHVWMLFDKKKRTWPDRLSDTHLVMTPKREKIFAKKKSK